MKSFKLYLRYSGACKIYNKVWFPNREFNGVFSINLDDFTVEYKKKIPFLETWIEQAYYGNINCIYDNKIFFFPFNCQFVMVYDTQDNDIQGIPINTVDGSDTYGTAGIIQCDEVAWIFPIKMSQGIFVLDLNEMRIKRDVDLENVLNDIDIIYNYENVVRLNKTEIAILSGNHTIIGIDVKTRKRLFTKRFDELNIWGIRYDGNAFWLLLYDSTDIYEWDPEENTLVKYHLLQEEWINGKGVPYFNIIFLNDQIIVLPCCLKYIMRINTEAYTISKAVEYPKGFYFFDSLMSVTAFAGFTTVDQHKVLIHPVRGNMLLIYDIEKNCVEGKELTVTAEEIPYLKEVIDQRFYQEDGIVQETDDFGLELLDLGIVQNRKNKNSLGARQIGDQIYNFLVKQQ